MIKYIFSFGEFYSFFKQSIHSLTPDACNPYDICYEYHSNYKQKETDDDKSNSNHCFEVVFGTDTCLKY